MVTDMASLIAISRLSDAIAYQANAAKLLAPFAAETSEAHLKNVRTLYEQLGKELGVSVAAAPDLLEALPDLSPVISWLENGCDPASAAKELRTYQARIDAAKNKAEGQPNG